MKSIVAILLLLTIISLVLGEDNDDDERVCYHGAARVAFENGEWELYAARERETTCYSSQSGCGGVYKFGMSIGWDSKTRSIIGDTYKQWNTLDLGCVIPTVCEQFTGNDTTAKCVYTDYSFVRYDPQSCNASTSYDAKYYYQTVRMYYGCCQDEDKCIDISRDSDENTVRELRTKCTKNTVLGEYIEDLIKCWQIGREIFRRYFICSDDGRNIVEYQTVCSNEYGEWDRDMASNTSNGEECFYRPTWYIVYIYFIYFEVLNYNVHIIIL